MKKLIVSLVTAASLIMGMVYLCNQINDFLDKEAMEMNEEADNYGAIPQW